MQPYVISGKSGQPFYRLDSHIMTETLSSCPIELTPLQEQIVKGCDEFSDKALFKVFSKKKSQKDFFDNLDEAQLTQFIRPYIERKMAGCFDLIRETDIKVFLKEKNYQVVYGDDLIAIVKGRARPLFNFVKAVDQSRYFLTVMHGDNELRLNNQVYTILTNEPCNVIISNTLFSVENIDAKKLTPFFTKEFVSIPKVTEIDYFSKFVRNAIKRYDVKAEGFFIERLNEKPQPVLSVQVNLRGELSFLLNFVYGTTAFHSNSESEPYVSMEEYNDTYRFFIIERDLKIEQIYIAQLKSFGLTNNSMAFFDLPNSEFIDPLQQEYCFINWVNQHSDELTNAGFSLETSKMDKPYFIGSVQLNIDTQEQNDWFDVHARVYFGDFSVPFAKLRKYILNNIREYKLPDGNLVILPEEWFSRYRDIFALGEITDDSIRVRTFHYNLLRETKIIEQPQSDDRLRQDLSTANFDSLPLPNGIQANLRNYQRQGYYWLYQLYANHFGGCLADDMGLGKTLQTITLLAKIRDNKVPSQLELTEAIPDLFSQQHPQHPTSIIIMPVSLVHNWEREIKKFAPELTIHKFMGTQRTRSVLNFKHVDIILTSYGVVRNDIDLLKKFHYHYVILDESQAIKNPESKIYKAVSELQAEHRLVLTGTPIENSLIDLWAQMNFVNKGLLGSLSYFKDQFVYPIEKLKSEEKQQRLRDLISPFILRRTKEKVAPELPELTEQVIYCEMSAAQRSLYEAEKSKIRNLIFENIEAQGVQHSAILILKSINRLRLMANHPVLTEPDYIDDSGKFEEVIRHIENVANENHKVLIFSSYVKHLELVRDALEGCKIGYSMLTGATVDRARVINEFQNNTRNKVFLISLKAGGTGLNLTSADYVFLLDPWWNPAAENQAISRAHRMGQTNNVFVYRFITRDTIEEKIRLLQEKKSAMADLFINTNNPFRSMDKNDIKELFQ